MAFTKNTSVYFNHIGTAFSGLFHRPIIAHMLLMQCSQLTGVWVVIAAKLSSTDIATSTYLLASREILGAFILTSLVQANRFFSSQILWVITLVFSIVGAIILGFSPLYSALFISAAIIGTSCLRSSTCIIAVDSLAVMQNDKHSAVRLSLFMLISPFSLRRFQHLLDGLQK